MAIQFHKKVLFLLFFPIWLWTQDFGFRTVSTNKPLNQIPSNELFRLAEKNYQEEKYNNVILYLTEYLERQPAKIEAEVLLIKSYLHLNDISNAKNRIQKNLKIYPDQNIFKILHGFVLVEEGKLKEAENLINELDAKNLQKQEFFELKGNYYFKLNQYALSDFFYKKYLESNPLDKRIYRKIIQNLLAQNQISKAEEYAREFQKLFFDSIEVYKINGEIHYKKAFIETNNKQKNLNEAYQNLKTYVNYTGGNPELLNKLMLIAYLLNSKDKIQSIKSEFDFETNDLLLLANKNDFLELDNASTLKDLCSRTEYFFSCPRYDLFLLEKRIPFESLNRNKFYYLKAKEYKKKLDNENFLFSLKYAELFYPKNIEIKKEYLEYYQDNHYYEDFFLTLHELIRSEPEEVRWRILMRRFLEEMKDYPFLRLTGAHWINLKDFYQREKETILVFNPYPLEQNELHFKEPEILRNYIKNFINFIHYFQTIKEEDWSHLKTMFFRESRYYLFYQPELLPVLKEWENEKKVSVHFLLESFYRISPNRFQIDFVLRSRDGYIIKKDSFISNNPKQEEKLGVFLKQFLLRSVPLKAKYIGNHNGNIAINVGKIDLIKKDDIFKNQNQYYRVKEVYPYTSLLELIKGESKKLTPQDIFYRENLNL
ncbi:MAG: hypothetical protein NZ853_00115 [Leptospiraceae bacterium]|nr:hypothetical protein [Leptospiraceae bacterium]MDW7976367.1 hypothetical protein [Leptospiraceae bacterium]